MLYQVLTSDGKDKCNCNCNDKSRSLRDDNKRTSNDKDKDKDKETKTRQQTATTATVLSVSCDVPKSCYIEGKCLPTDEGNCLALVVAFGTWFGLFL
jgi:hypothetical protein